MNTYHLTYITPSSRMEIGTPRFWKQMQGWHYGDHNTITVNAVNRKEAKSVGMAKARKEAGKGTPVKFYSLKGRAS